MKSLVSVIVTCYNYGQYIEEAIESILKSTYKNLEIIVVDDGSTDEYTIGKLKDLEKKFLSLKILRISNSGVCIARNIGIKNSNGEYILCLDADDKIGSRIIEKAVKYLDLDKEILVINGEVEYFGYKVGKMTLPEFTLDELLKDNMLVASCLFRKKDWKRVNGYDLQMKNGIEDYEFWISILKDGGKVKRIDDTLLFYRQHKISRNKTIEEEKLKKLYEYILMKHFEIYLKTPAAFEKIFNKIYPKNKKEIKKLKKEIKILKIFISLIRL